ncbi:MAG: hypothetical protein GF355_02460 [Candidatus Eisenbacteria bacterium]|nr:hypothetical protein [Candidatus Eisenbacteria bacterium]
MKRSAWAPGCEMLLILGLLCGGLFSGTPAAADDSEGVVTNLNALKKVAERSLESILDSLDVPQGEKVYLRAAGHHEANWMISDLLARLLSRRGALPVVLHRPAPPPIEPQDDGDQEDESGAPEGDVGADEDEEGGAAGEGDAAGGDDTGEDDPLAGEDEDQAGDGDDPFADEDDESGGADDPFAEDGEDFAEDGEDEAGSGADEGDGADSDEAAASQAGDSAAGNQGLEGEDDPAEPEEKPKRPAVVPTAPQVDGPVIEYRVLNLGVVYPSSKRSLILMGSKSITRLATAHLLLRKIREPEGIIEDVRDAEDHAVDRFSSGLLPYVEGPDYPFQPPALEPTPWRRMVEPAAVVAIVSGLVYLFYENQN